MRNSFSFIGIILLYLICSLSCSKLTETDVKLRAIEAYIQEDPSRALEELDSYGHHKTHKEYNNAWQVFFDKNEKPTIELIESFAQQLMAEIYGYNYTPTL